MGDIRQDVHRIAYDQNHRRRLLEHDFINDVVDDFDIALQQLQTRFAGPLFGPGRNHNQVGIRIIRRLGFMNLDRREKRLAMNQIENLPQGQFMVGIAQGNLIGQTALGQRIGKSGTHGARANNHHFSRFPTFIIHFCSSAVVQTVVGNGNVKHLSGLQIANRVCPPAACPRYKSEFARPGWLARWRRRPAPFSFQPLEFSLSPPGD